MECWMDQDTAFKAEFQEAVDLLGAVTTLAPVEWHDAIAPVEARIKGLREQLEIVVHEQQIVGEEDMMAAAIGCAQASNRLARHGGFTPSQWVLGRGLRLPELLRRQVWS